MLIWKKIYKKIFCCSNCVFMYFVGNIKVIVRMRVRLLGDNVKMIFLII